ncbi:MAG: DNA repair protein RecO [Pseudomonadota bacterium]
MAVREALQPAYVLHRRDYQETSLILEAMTRDHGRLGLLARGARRSKRGRAGTLQAFQPLLLSWSGRGELPVVTAVELAGTPPAMAPAVLPHGFYLNELLMALLPRDDAHAEVFYAYAEALAGLSGDAELALRRFETTLLRELGLAPDLETDAETGLPVSSGTRYRFELERGPVARNADSSAWTVDGDTLLGLQAGALAGEQRREGRRLMQLVLAHYLGGRELKSRELFRRQKQQQ